MIKTRMLSYCFVLFLFFHSQTGLCCSAFHIKNGNLQVVGSNLDYPSGIGSIFLNKRNVSKIALPPISDQEPAQWISRYGSITSNVFSAVDIPKEGINEAGLVVIELTLNATIDPDPDSRAYISNYPSWVQYQLDNSSSVEEVIESDAFIRPYNAGPFHYFVSDIEGNSAVIEFLDGEMVYQTNETMPYEAITNNTYEESLDILSNFEGFGGTYPIPGHNLVGSLSPFRFVKSVYRLENYDGSDPVDYAFDTLEYVKNINPDTETTWSFVYDISNFRVYFRTKENPTIRFFDLRAFNFSCETPIRFLDINSDLSGDVSGDFIDSGQQPICVLLGDFDEDGCVDRMDFNMIIADIRGSEPHDMTYDLNEDGDVNIADARYMATLFTNPRGIGCE